MTVDTFTARRVAKMQRLIREQADEQAVRLFVDAPPSPEYLALCAAIEQHDAARKRLLELWSPFVLARYSRTRF